MGVLAEHDAVASLPGAHRFSTAGGVEGHASAGVLAGADSDIPHAVRVGAAGVESANRGAGLDAGATNPIAERVSLAGDVLIELRAAGFARAGVLIPLAVNISAARIGVALVSDAASRLALGVCPLAHGVLYAGRGCENERALVVAGRALVHPRALIVAVARSVGLVGILAADAADELICKHAHAVSDALICGKTLAPVDAHICSSVPHALVVVIARRRVEMAVDARRTALLHGAIIRPVARRVRCTRLVVWQMLALL